MWLLRWHQYGMVVQWTPRNTLLIGKYFCVATQWKYCPAVTFKFTLFNDIFAYVADLWKTLSKVRQHMFGLVRSFLHILPCSSWHHLSNIQTLMHQEVLYTADVHLFQCSPTISHTSSTQAYHFLIGTCHFKFLHTFLASCFPMPFNFFLTPGGLQGARYMLYSF